MSVHEEKRKGWENMDIIRRIAAVLLAAALCLGAALAERK